MASQRDLITKVSDWKTAYDAVKGEITPGPLRAMLDVLVNTPLPGTDGDVSVFTARLNASLAVARLVSANDRAAATVAILMTANGVKPIAVDYGEDT